MLSFFKPQACQKSNKKILNTAFEILQRIVKKNNCPRNKRKFAIILDIDGTCVYNTVNDGHRVNKDVYQIYRWALENCVAVFFLTARPDTPKNRNYTLNDLAKSSYTTYEGLIMRPESDERKNGSNYSAYKAAERAKINRHYEVIMNCGDTFQDMTVLVSTEPVVPLNKMHAFLGELSHEKSYILMLTNAVPMINIKLKTEK